MKEEELGRQVSICTNEVNKVSETDWENTELGVVVV